MIDPNYNYTSLSSCVAEDRLMGLKVLTFEYLDGSFLSPPVLKLPKGTTAVGLSHLLWVSLKEGLIDSALPNSYIIA